MASIARFTGLTVTDDQFTLTTTDWDGGVNGLRRSAPADDRLTIDNARARFNGREAVIINRTFTVDYAILQLLHVPAGRGQTELPDTTRTFNLHASARPQRYGPHDYRTHGVAPVFTR